MSASALLPLVFGIIVMLYGVSPLLVWLTQGVSAQPHFEPYDPARQQIGEDLVARVRDIVAALAAEGFRVAGDFFWEAPNTRVVLLQNDQAGQRATVLAKRLPTKTGSISKVALEFCTSFADGRELCVNNNSDPGIFAAVPGKRVERLADVRDPRQLYRVHQAVERRFYGATSRTEFDERRDPVDVLRIAVLHEMEKQLATGYFRLDETAARYRPTLRGAFLMTWKLLPPVRQMRAWRLARRARALLAESGVG